ncbi:hypothetical protein Pelo_16154 [Pelomyxa schiedti]|nr:hypothetical protein Pelo_16154 [Pelomyxa schiedti]
MTDQQANHQPDAPYSPPADDDVVIIPPPLGAPSPSALLLRNDAGSNSRAEGSGRLGCPSEATGIAEGPGAGTGGGVAVGEGCGGSGARVGVGAGAGVAVGGAGYHANVDNNQGGIMGCQGRGGGGGDCCCCCGCTAGGDANGNGNGNCGRLDPVSPSSSSCGGSGGGGGVMNGDMEGSAAAAVTNTGSDCYSSSKTGKRVFDRRRAESSRRKHSVAQNQTPSLENMSVSTCLQHLQMIESASLRLLIWSVNTQGCRSLYSSVANEIVAKASDVIQIANAITALSPIGLQQSLGDMLLTKIQLPHSYLHPSQRGNSTQQEVFNPQINTPLCNNNLQTSPHDPILTVPGSTPVVLRHHNSKRSRPTPQFSEYHVQGTCSQSQYCTACSPDSIGDITTTTASGHNTDSGVCTTTASNYTPANSTSHHSMGLPTDRNEEYNVQQPPLPLSGTELPREAIAEELNTVNLPSVSENGCTPPADFSGLPAVRKKHHSNKKKHHSSGGSHKKRRVALNRGANLPNTQQTPTTALCPPLQQYPLQQHQDPSSLQPPPAPSTESQQQPEISTAMSAPQISLPEQRYPQIPTPTQHTTHTTPPTVDQQQIPSGSIPIDKLLC